MSSAVARVSDLVRSFAEYVMALVAHIQTLVPPDVDSGAVGGIAGALALTAAVILVVLRALRGRRMRRSVKLLAGPRAWTARREASRHERRRSRGAALAAVESAIGRMRPGRVLSTRLAGAGMRISPARFLLTQVLCAVVGAGAGWLWLGTLSACAGAALGLCAPLILVSVRRGRRKAQFEKQLPEATEALAAALQAGASLPQGMERIARELRPPLAGELRRLIQETHYGLAWPDALSSLQRRTGGDDVLLLASAISIQQRVGGDLVVVLRGLAATMRERLRLRSEIQIQTAQSRYSAYVIGALPILLFTFLWFTNRPYISVLFEPGLRLLLGGAVAGLLIGFFLMQRIVKMDV